MKNIILLLSILATTNILASTWCEKGKHDENYKCRVSINEYALSVGQCSPFPWPNGDVEYSAKAMAVEVFQEFEVNDKNEVVSDIRYNYITKQSVFSGVYAMRTMKICNEKRKATPTHKLADIRKMYGLK
ncbi:hypothetical protein ABMA70_02095 [Halobacteriovorax sp. XZX-3]|uniref:hypothetical protein n=1 Tax=unclassified Halobacteriovorax TaxID=2639665 RepID=UPI000CD21355|nr:hypothetical protein [Halobacteriovorax sp. DA5]POB14536.1 hypothetical protein C0Z22_05435 [Halobacteriovorax sp. DA5]